MQVSLLKVSWLTGFTIIWITCYHSACIYAYDHWNSLFAEILTTGWGGGKDGRRANRIFNETSEVCGWFKNKEIKGVMEGINLVQVTQ